MVAQWRSALTISAATFVACLVLITLASIATQKARINRIEELEVKHKANAPPKRVLGTNKLRAAFPGVKEKVLIFL
jgi:hypothetical protein